MTFKKIPYSKPSLNSNDLKLANQALRSDYLTGGVFIKKFDAALCKKYSSDNLGSKENSVFAQAVSSGTAALLLAILAVKIKKNKETKNNNKKLAIITPSLNFVAGANQIKFAGLEVIFCDCDPIYGLARFDDFILAYNQAIKKNYEILAFMPMDLGGKISELSKIHNFAKKNNIAVIEDACHSIGSVYKGSKIGSCEYCDITVFSFHAIKTISLGEGGAILTKDKEISHIIGELKTHGKNYVGFNARLPEVLAALGLSQLKRLDQTIKKRNNSAKYYDKILAGIEEIQIINKYHEDLSAYHLYQIRFNDDDKNKTTSKSNTRDKVRELLAKLKIESQIHYIPSHKYSYHKNQFENLSLENTINFSNKCLALPLFTGITKSQQDFVVAKLKQAIQQVR